jgi:hypothetical protein
MSHTGVGSTAKVLDEFKVQLLAATDPDLQGPHA